MDLLPSAEPGGKQGNPGDVVEIRADLVVDASSTRDSSHTQERIDWMLEQGEDE